MSLFPSAVAGDKPSAHFANIAAHLPAMAASRPDDLAVAAPTGRDRHGKTTRRALTFAQLDTWSDELARGLVVSGIGPGVRTVLMVPPSLEFYALTFALFKAGAVPVLVDPGMGVSKLGHCLAEAAPSAFVGIGKAHLARVVLGWARSTINTTVHVGRIPLPFGLDLETIARRGRDADEKLPWRSTRPDDLAAILFTSGSTGPPKGAEYRHATFQAQVQLLKQLYGITPGERDLPTFPLFGLFGPALGMSALIPRMNPTRPAEVDPIEIIETIANHEVTNMFGSPALIDRVGRHLESTGSGLALPSLRRVISAGAPVQAAILARFVPCLTAGAEVHTPYGATEALPVSSIGSRTILNETREATDRGAGVCVGHPAPGIDVEIIGINDGPIGTWSDDLRQEPSRVGEIVVRGPVVTRAYFGRPEADRLAKISDRNGDVLHRMGDLGYRDDQGRIWFCGRKTQRVVTRSRTLFTIPCEAVFNTHPAIKRSALVGIPQGSEDEVTPLLCVERFDDVNPHSDSSLHEDLERLASAQEHTRAISMFWIRSTSRQPFPVDIRHNAKIGRERLAIEASKKFSTPPR